MQIAALLLSALAIALSFPPYGLAHLIWIALIPWFWVLEKNSQKKVSAKKRFTLGLTLSLFISITLFQWIAYAVHEYGMLPWILAFIVLLGYGCIGQLQYVAFSLLAPNIFTDPRRLPFALKAATLYTALDYLIPKLFMDTQGHAFAHSLLVLQAADLIGAYGLTFLVIFVNAWIFKSLSFAKTEDKSKHLIQSAAPLVLLAMILTLYGTLRKNQIDSLTGTESSLKQVRLGVIQANIGDIDKLASERGIKSAVEKVLTTYFEFSNEALAAGQRPDALVWPETAFPGAFRSGISSQERAQEKQVEDFVIKTGVPLLFGGYDHESSPEGGQDFNSFILLATSLKAEVYHKSVLLPFGEYIPFLENFEAPYRWFRGQFPQMGFFGRGPGPQAIKLPDLSHEVRVSPLICYEALFPAYSREAVKKGAQLLLNITNDSWFGPWGEPHLHFALSVFRSIETRTPQVRVTNTGFSALILPSGEVVGQSQLFTPQVLTYNAPVRPAGTPAPWTLILLLGDWFGPLCVLMSVLLVLGQSCGRFFREFFLKNQRQGSDRSDRNIG